MLLRRTGEAGVEGDPVGLPVPALLDEPAPAPAAGAAAEPVVAVPVPAGWAAPRLWLSRREGIARTLASETIAEVAPCDTDVRIGPDRVA